MIHQLRQSPDVELVGLLTTFNEKVDRVTMHGVSRALVQAQAEQLQLPLWPVPVPFPCNNEQFQDLFLDMLTEAAQQGITHLAFGDIFLADVRQYRCELLEDSGIEPLFPLWCGGQGRMTGQLAGEMQSSGLAAIVTCVDPRQLSPDFLGRCYDADFLRDLPEEVDPCGERGEFHTFCYAGPIFPEAVPIRAGKRVIRDGFHFLDLYLDGKCGGVDHVLKIDSND